MLGSSPATRPVPPAGERADTIPRASRVATLSAVVLPCLGFVAVLVLLRGRGFGWVDLGLLLGVYALTALGVTVGFHRLFTHKGFETNRVVRFVLAALGSMAVHGSVL